MNNDPVIGFFYGENNKSAICLNCKARDISRYEMMYFQYRYRELKEFLPVSPMGDYAIIMPKWPVRDPATEEYIRDGKGRIVYGKSVEVPDTYTLPGAQKFTIELFAPKGIWCSICDSVIITRAHISCYGCSETICEGELAWEWGCKTDEHERYHPECVPRDREKIRKKVVEILENAYLLQQKMGRHDIAAICSDVLSPYREGGGCPRSTIERLEDMSDSLEYLIQRDKSNDLKPHQALYKSLHKQISDLMTSSSDEYKDEILMRIARAIDKEYAEKGVYERPYEPLWWH